MSFRRARIRPISKKRAATLPSRAEVREAVWSRDGGRCRAESFSEVPCGGPLDVHEVVPRSAWPGGKLVEANCILLCRQSHDWVHQNPNHARGLGLLAHSWDRPDGAA